MLDDKIIHDLKNPLSTIFGTVDLFLDGTLGKLTGEQEGYLENIQESAKRLNILLAELQFIGNAEKRESSVSKSTFPAAELIEELSWLRRSAEKNNKTIDLHSDPALMVQADKDLTSTIIEDLLLNAVKQTEHGGKIELNIKKIGGSYRFEIKVAGEVIPKKFSKNAFDKDFIEKKPQFRANISPGMGFYFCKLAAEAQGGRIGIELNSKETSFYFVLPA